MPETGRVLREHVGLVLFEQRGASIFFALGMYLLGVRPLLSAVITGVVVGLVIFGLFTLIGINLPSNFLVG